MRRLITPQGEKTNRREEKNVERAVLVWTRGLTGPEIKNNGKSTRDFLNQEAHPGELIFIHRNPIRDGGGKGRKKKAGERLWKETRKENAQRTASKKSNSLC